MNLFIYLVYILDWSISKENIEFVTDLSGLTRKTNLYNQLLFSPNAVLLESRWTNVIRHNVTAYWRLFRLWNDFRTFSFTLSFEGLKHGEGLALTCLTKVYLSCWPLFSKLSSELTLDHRNCWFKILESKNAWVTSAFKSTSLKSTAVDH